MAIKDLTEAQQLKLRRLAAALADRIDGKILCPFCEPDPSATGRQELSIHPLTRRG